MFKINSKINLRRVVSGLIIVLGLILLGLAITAKVASQSKPVETPVETKIEYTIDKSEKQTVFDALKEESVSKNFELKYSNDPRYGVFVESITGVKNGDNGKYWQYYVNGTLGDVAADKKEVKAGDKVEWRFETVPEF